MIRRLLANQQALDKAAVIENGSELCYGALLRKAWAVIGCLPRGRCENVAILLPNGGEYIAAFWAVIMAGATAFPLNTAMTMHEIAPLLRQASVHRVITGAAYCPLFHGRHGPELILMEELAPADSEPDGLTAADPDEVMVLLGTSGTTGCSKIVRLSERNVETAVLGYLDRLRFDDELTRYILAVPFSSVYGLMILSACLLRSFPVIVPEQPLTLDMFYRMAEKHKATHYEGGAALVQMMEQMAGRPVPYDLRRLTYIGFGGSKVTGDTIDTLLRAYPELEFYQGYGMTEAAPLITKHPQARLTKTNSVGIAIRGVELAVDTEGGLTDAPFTEGEIAVRGANVMLGYLDNQTETDRVLKNGWLYTGDMGYLDNEGYLYIIGRKKNIIIVRGFTVYPEEVEACIQSSGLVKDCLVYGRSDGQGGETICADIVTLQSETGADDIRAHCQTHLAEYKRPRVITLCSGLRKTATGKLERVPGL